MKLKYSKDISMNEIIDLYLIGEYDVPCGTFIDDCDFYFEHLDYFNV